MYGEREEFTSDRTRSASRSEVVAGQRHAWHGSRGSVSQFLVRSDERLQYRLFGEGLVLEELIWRYLSVLYCYLAGDMELRNQKL